MLSLTERIKCYVGQRDDSGLAYFNQWTEWRLRYVVVQDVKQKLVECPEGYNYCKKIVNIEKDVYVKSKSAKFIYFKAYATCEKEQGRGTCNTDACNSVPYHQKLADWLYWRFIAMHGFNG